MFLCFVVKKVQENVRNLCDLTVEIKLTAS